MIHYDYVEWLLYKNKALPNNKMEEMEKHLYNCQICMDIFLSLIDEQEVEHVGKIVPLDFTEKILECISKDKVTEIKSKKVKKAINYPFGYYVAVASVTIFLTLGGFYTNLVDAVPKITTSIQEVEVRPNLIANFSNKIVNLTSNLLLGIEKNEKNK